MVKDPRQAGLEQISLFRRDLGKLVEADKGIADVVVLLCDVIAETSPPFAEAMQRRIDDELSGYHRQNTLGTRETFHGLLEVIQRTLERG